VQIYRALNKILFSLRNANFLW